MASAKTETFFLYGNQQHLPFNFLRTFSLSSPFFDQPAFEQLFLLPPPLTFPSQTALRAQRPLLPDRAGGRLHPALLLRPGALPPGAVGGLGRAQHAQVLHTHHARIHSPGESVAVALQKGKKKFCSYCPPLFLVREALCWVRFTCAREQIALGEIG